MTTATIGIIGAGHLGASLMHGLRAAALPGDRVLVAPRGPAPRELARATGFRVAADAADLVRRSDIVLVCVRPDQVGAALEGLPWRSGQTAVSTLAAVPLAVVAAIVAPAGAVRAMPMTAAAIGASPTAIYPPDPATMALLGVLGPVIPLTREADLDASTAGSLLYALGHFAVDRTAAWLVERGFPDDTARAHAVAHLGAAAAMMRADGRSRLATLATPGGVTEAALARAEEKGLSVAWEAALDAAHARIRAVAHEAGRAPAGAREA